MPARISAFVVWALVLGAAVFWGLRFVARPTPVPAHAVAVAQSVTLVGDLSRVLGRPAVAAAAPAAEAPAAPAIASRLRLVGVMAPRPGRPPQAGLAMIAIDGKPARPYVPGASVEGDLVLQSVGLRTASIGPTYGAPVVTLEMPRLAAAATGTLPVAISAGAPPTPQVAPAIRGALPPTLPRPGVPIPARSVPPVQPQEAEEPQEGAGPILVPPPPNANMLRQ